MIERMSEMELGAEIAFQKNKADLSEREFHEARHYLGRLEKEQKDRRRHRSVIVPFWALEVLSAHARKRFENLSTAHTTKLYESALHIASSLVGHVVPSEIPGEYHDPSKKGRR